MELSMCCQSPQTKILPHGVRLFGLFWGFGHCCLLFEAPFFVENVNGESLAQEDIKNKRMKKKHRLL